MCLQQCSTFYLLVYTADNDGDGRGFEERGERSWRGGSSGGQRGGDRGGSRGYRGRGRGRGGRGRGGGWQNRGGSSRMPDEEDEDGDVRMEGKRW